MPNTMTTGVAPGALPILGHALRLRKDPLNFLRELPSHGDLVQIRIGPQRAYVLCNADLMHQVLRDDRTYDKTGLLWDQLQELLGDGLTTCPHSRHRKIRRLVQPAFHHERFDGYAQVMAEAAGAVVGKWQHGEEIDLPTEMNAITSGTLVKTLIAGDFSESDIATIHEGLQYLVDSQFRRMLMPRFLEKMPTPANLRSRAVNKNLRDILQRVIMDYRADGVDHDDVLSILLAARDDDGNGLSDLQIWDQVVTVFLAGTETTATLLSWTLHLLAAHPDIERELHEEVDSVLAGRTATLEDIPRLPLCDGIIQETLRLYPPAWLLTRSVTAPAQLAGHRLVPGDVVVCSPYLIHRSEELYADADRFDPHRWTTSQARQPRGAYVPFSTGPRKCIGDVFGMTQAVLALSTIAGRWRLRPAPGTELRPVARLALMPEPKHVRTFDRALDGAPTRFTTPMTTPG
ncbi:cytochrome P450 [Streptomyces sp. NPDC050433]|uniref:cytochrome P450 n=1 Tax=Streptomyces sp. NPDC050433 TaxID=3365615 RepID=UPI00378A3FA7